MTGPSPRPASRSTDAPPVVLPPVDERSLASARLLMDLVGNTLDPGYAAAARHRDPDAPRRWWERPAVALGALAIGFLLVVSYVHTNRGAPEAERVHDRLVDRVRSAQDGADRLESEVERAGEQLDRAQADALPEAGALSRELSREQLQAGQVAVRGPGLRVTLREPAAPTASSEPDRPGSVPISSTHILTDRDVRAVVNQLWSDGAEAIAVNGVRLTPTSAIRFAGEAVLVDFRPLTSPYRIEAIGDADTLATDFAQSPVASKYQTLAGASGIGFTFGNQSALNLPASTPISPRYASPAPARPSKQGSR